MSAAPPSANAPALRGWRERAWAWVLFAALLKGLIPHAALASVVMAGHPALLWCAPGSNSAAGELKAVGEIGAAGHECVCAASGEALPGGGDAAFVVSSRALQAPTAGLPAALSPRRLPNPPARGPPTI